MIDKKLKNIQIIIIFLIYYCYEEISTGGKLLFF